MDIDRIKINIEHEKQILNYLNTLKNDKYDVESAKKYVTTFINKYQNCVDKTTDEHKQLCESLKKEFHIV